MKRKKYGLSIKQLGSAAYNQAYRLASGRTKKTYTKRNLSYNEGKRNYRYHYYHNVEQEIAQAEHLKDCYDAR